jgi:chemotaxis protein methyltransferase CheR
MTQKISEDLLAQFSDFLTAKIGLFFPPNRRQDLARGLKAAAPNLGCDSAELCIRQLMTSPLTRPQIEVLASHLTVGETYFFREKKSLAVLENHILPELIRSRRERGRRLRIWSAGCASGEEAYTLAIAVYRAIADLKNWQIHILATDINPKALQKASRGVYSKWSFRDTPPEIMENYFIQRDRGYEILPHIKGMVNFAYLNLMEDTYPALASQTNAMDLIFCRNVLMYFATAQSQKVLKNLGRCLVEGGWLLVGVAEICQARRASLATVNFPEASVYRKDSSGKICLTLQRAVSPVDQTIQRSSLPVIQEPVREQPAWVPPSEAPMTSLPEPSAGQGIEFDEAAVAGEGTLPGEPDRVQDMALRARDCADLGELSQARRWCEQALAADRLNPALHYLHAAVMQEQEALEEAALALRKAIYLDQDFVMAHFAMGNLALRRGDARGARKHFDNVLALLDGYQQDELLPESEGITVGRMREIVLSTISMRKLGERKAAIK